MKEMLKINNLNVVFETNGGLVQANRGINLDVNVNETSGIMGESGCGKTVLFLSLLRLQQPGKIMEGSILFKGRDLVKLSEGDMRRIRGRELALIPQDHATALNPSYNVGEQLREAVVVRDSGGSLWQGFRGRMKADKARLKYEIESILNGMALGEMARTGDLLKRYPHQLSGGIRQRILIAMALLAKPDMLIADEPTTALDRATRMQTLDLFRGLRGSMTMLIISHDLEAISRTCDRVAVMYGGRIIERGPTNSVFDEPRHPYTKLLISCQKVKRGVPLPSVRGDVLNLIDFPPGCSFHPNCPRAMPVCSRIEPWEYSVDSVKVSCHLYNGGSGQ